MIRTPLAGLVLVTVLLGHGCRNPTYAFDFDGDGWDDEDDCAPENKAIHPEAVDPPFDGIDQDCDECPEGSPDGAGDGIDRDCDGFAANGDGADADLDCNDSEANTWPGAPELCDDVDNDCDGTVDEGAGEDADGDSYFSCLEDCDDTDGAIHPGAVEICDGRDNDCDVATNEDVDDDVDGFTECEGDCDDNDAQLGPHLPETCNGADDDCDDVVDDDCVACDRVVPDDHVAIAGAIAAAGHGEVVCVRPGTYVENLDFGGKAVHLLGLGGTDDTVIDGNASGPVVTFASGEGAGSILESFRLTNGEAADGGGIFIDSASPTLTHLWIDDNHALSRGGGLFLVGGMPELDNVRFTDNQADDYGGGIATYQDSNPRVKHTLISGNWANYDGGGVWSQGMGGSHLDNVVITDNMAEQGYGGGIYASDYNAPVLDHVVIDGNEAGEDGGGIAFRTSTWPMSVSNSVILFNDADAGGAVSVVGGDVELSYCDIYANSPTDWDGMDSPVGTDGNLQQNPAFADVLDLDPANWDHHLNHTSPLIDAGDPSTIDPDGSRADIGPYGGPEAGGWDLDHDGWYEWWQQGEYNPAQYPALGLDCDDLDDEIGPDEGC
jgi:hypothetical protein